MPKRGMQPKPKVVELLPLPPANPAMLEMQSLMDQARAEILKSFLLPPEMVRLWPTQLEMIEGRAWRRIMMTATGLAVRRIKTN